MKNAQKDLSCCLFGSFAETHRSGALTIDQIFFGGIMFKESKLVKVNGRSYRLDTPPVVGICLDGTDPSYLEAAKQYMPNLSAIAARGARGTVNSVIPSFTNPNNVAIATGAPPSVNGICGNFYYDELQDKEVMMDDPKYLRSPTLFATFAEAGRKVAVVTAKDKLRRLLGHNLEGICFSVEKAGPASFAEQNIEEMAELHGGVIPGIYDPDASIYCLEAGAMLLENGRADLLYLSTTDFVQHKYAPGSEIANQFYGSVDAILATLDGAGAIIVLTADHGMNSKANQDGSPRIEFLETFLKETGFADASVILPITDPYVIHHGALGSYATIYLTTSDRFEVRKKLLSVPGTELVLTREEAAARFHLPPDRIGDLVVLGDQWTTFGRTPDWHDLSGVSIGLRSHGGLHERKVPFIINRPLLPEYAERLASETANNYDLFEFALNGVRN